MLINKNDASNIDYSKSYTTSYYIHHQLNKVRWKMTANAYFQLFYSIYSFISILCTFLAFISHRRTYVLAIYLCSFVHISLAFAGHNSSNLKLKTADDLGVPICTNNDDCVYGGVCVKDKQNVNRCFCSSSCPLNVPVQCVEDNEVSCVTMGEQYTMKYDMRAPICYYKRCTCPPAFDHNLLQPPIPGFKATLPMKCDRRELQAMVVASPSDSVYRSTAANIYCCVNVDPRTFVPSNGVYFVQNGTRKREPTTTPYENFSKDIDTLFTVPTCWILHINNVQMSDSGSYTCIVQPVSPKYRTMNVSMDFVVKTPRMIQNLDITENTTSALVTWTTQEGPLLKIDLALFDRYVKAKEVWRKENVKSPVLIDGLQPGTPYTLFILIRDGQSSEIRLSRQFSTNAIPPDPPPLDAIRLVNGEDIVGQLCELEWRPAHREREFITRYYVKISGKLRYVSPDDHSITAEDHPQGAESCVNYYRDADKYINATTFHKRFLACKYGPLKPNRNYSASVWVENEAGKSRPAVFEGQCVTDFAEPDFIEPPQSLPPTNMSTFTLVFNTRPDESNGPIVCYYLAVVPLPTNVTIEKLPEPASIVMDNFDKALQNNLQESAMTNNRFYAYIAESYMQYPKQTVVGDGNTSGGTEKCNMYYLGHFPPRDPALTPNLKYTGFLIARVDRDRSLQAQARIMTGSGSGDPAKIPTAARTTTGRSKNMLSRNNGLHYVYSRRTRRSLLDVPRTLAPYSQVPKVVIPISASTSWDGPISVRRRELTNLDPGYGFSGYFKPVTLQENTESGSLLYVLLATFFALLALFSAFGAFYCFRHRKDTLHAIRDQISQIFSLFWMRSKHDLLKTTPPQPIKVDELANEYVMRHRDSNFHFTQEFEMLPRGKDLDHSTSDRNARKNRYNDIKACDATRVKLRKITGDNTSDYINANFIKGYRSRKVFIASQGPLENTVDDFWRMVWEQGSKIIIMVTNLRERCREQCVKYWPDDDRNPLVFRNLTVKNVQSTYFAEYALREFEVSELETSANVNATGANISSNLGATAINENRSPSSLSDVIQNSTNGFSRPSSAMKESASGPCSLNYVSSARPGSKTGFHEDSPKERRRVFQYHFTCWHDYKAPECVALLRLIGKLRKMDDYNNSPVIVHCSAGVGRTGTLIAIDYLMDQCQEEGKADVFNCVSEMRQQRNLMVQSVEQYAFIYKALAEYQLFGDTDLSDVEFRSYYTRLRLPLMGRERERHYSVGSTRSSARSNSIVGAQSVHLDDRSCSSKSQSDCSSNKAILTNTAAISAGIKAKLKLVRSGAAGVSAIVNNTAGVSTAPLGLSLLEAEFNNLSISLEKTRLTDWAHKPENVTRNRNPSSVPYDVNRVILSHFTGYDNTYINASSIKGYFYSYIMAQDPLDGETTFEFWRMIHDNNSYTLVMLSPEESFGRSEKFWPIDSTKPLILGKHGELTITLLHEETHPSCVSRRLKYSFKNEKEGTGREIMHYAFRQWKSEIPVPSNPAAFLELISVVLERQSYIPDAGPIVLHCRDGARENGIFCAISLLLERLKSEHMVDIFRTVKGLKLQRSQLFLTMDEYAFCYDCIMEYISSTTSPNRRANRFD